LITNKEDKVKRVRVLLLLLSLMFMLGCSQRTKMICRFESLLLGKINFPSGSTEDRITSPLSEEPDRSAARYIYLGKTPAYHVVIEYPSVKRAEERYDDFKHAIFLSELETFERPTLSLSKSTADEMSYGCLKSGERKVCSFIGRYKNLVTFFNIDVDNNGFSENDYKNSVGLIEEKISSCYKEIK